MESYVIILFDERRFVVNLRKLVTVLRFPFGGSDKREYSFLNSSDTKYVFQDNTQSVYSYEDRIESFYALDDTLRMGMSKHHVRLS